MRVYHHVRVYLSVRACVTERMCTYDVMPVTYDVMLVRRALRFFDCSPRAAPFMCVNMDSFVRIVKDEPPKEAIDGADGYDEEAQDEEAQRKREVCIHAHTLSFGRDMWAGTIA